MASQSSQPPTVPPCSNPARNAAPNFSTANLSQDLLQTLFPCSNLVAPTPSNISPSLSRPIPPPTHPLNGAQRSQLQSFKDETLTEALEFLLAQGDARNDTCENERHLARLTVDLPSASLLPTGVCRAQDTDSLLDAALPFLNQRNVESCGPARQSQAPTPATNRNSNGSGHTGGSLPRTFSVPGYRDHVKLLDALLSKEARRQGLQVPASFNNLGNNQSTGTTSQMLEQQARALSESFAQQKSAALTPKLPTQQSFSQSAPSLAVSRLQPQQSPMQRGNLSVLPQSFGLPFRTPSQPDLAMATLSAAALSARLPRQLSESPSSDKAEQSEDQRESFPGSTEKSTSKKKKFRRRHADRVSELEAQISTLRKTTSEAMEQLQKARETIRVLEKRNRELRGESAGELSEGDPSSLEKRRKIDNDGVLDEEPTQGVLMQEEDPKNVISGEQLPSPVAGEGNDNAQYIYEDLLEGSFGLVGSF